MAQQRPTSREIDRREDRWNLLWVFAPLVLLGIGTVLAMSRAGEPLTSKLISLAIALAVAAWYWRLVTYCDKVYRDFYPPLWLGATAFAGLFAAAWVLTARDLSFLWFAVALYMLAFIFLRGAWAYPGVLAAAALNALFQSAFGDDGINLTALVIGTVIGAVFSGVIGTIFRASESFSLQRKQIIQELEEAHRQLQASMDENAGLQRQLLAQAREAGVLDERQRMAGEIHDTLAQGLTGIITQLEAAEKTLGSDSEAQRHLDTARRLARDSLSEARRSVQALRPEPLEAARLPDALADVASRWSERSGVRAEFTVTGDAVPMHPEVEVTLLRTAQEALANVDRHARASRVGITLSYTDDQVLLDVRDDGAGFDASALPANGSRPDGGGFGLTAMRQRLARAAGTLEIESAPGQGTAVSASVPAVPAKDAATGEAPAADTPAVHAAAEDSVIVRDTPAAGGLPTPGGGS